MKEVKIFVFGRTYKSSDPDVFVVAVPADEGDMFETAQECAEMHGYESPFLCFTEADLHRIKELELLFAAKKPERMIVVLEGGMVTQILQDSENGPCDVAIVDYDAEGCDPDEIVFIPQDNGGNAEALGHIEPVAGCERERFDVIWAAVQQGPTSSDTQSLR